MDNPVDKDSQDLQQLRNLLDKLSSKYQISSQDLVAALDRSPLVPVEIFSTDLAPLEALVKYLKENQSHPNSEIAKLLDRSEKTIWQAYAAAKEKQPAPFVISSQKYSLPMTALQGRALSIMESVVKFLIEIHKLRYADVAALLKRDARTIWTVYHRAEVKLKDES